MHCVRGSAACALTRVGAWVCGYAWAANDAATFVGSFLLRVVNMLTLFLRRQVQMHAIEIRQAAAPHLSFCRSTAIVHCLLSLYIANRTFTQSQFATIFGGGRKFCTLYKSFLKIDYVGHHY